MPITSIEKDLTALTMTVVADFAVPLQRLWDAYADPRLIERFWGPPGWPATFFRHDMAPGGESRYVMNGPDGQTSAGWWEFLAVDAPNSFEVLDGFAGPDGERSTELPSMRMVFEFESTTDGSRLTATTTFDSADQLQQLLDMGMQEGMTAAMGQIDDVVADLAAFAADRPTALQVLDDLRVRTSRVIRGTVDQVWAAHHDADLMRRWLLGPDGWHMPVCEVAESVGDTFRQEWERDGGGDRFGFTGELLDSMPPYREVTTEQMIGVDGPGAVNELTLVPLGHGTLLTIVITYPDTETRDAVLGSGMVDGMETSYARLENQVLAAV